MTWHVKFGGKDLKRRYQKEEVEEESMDRSSSFGSVALKEKAFCQKCRQPTKLEQPVSRSERNFLRPYMSCMKCEGFICSAEEEGRRESRGGLQSGSSMYRGRQGVGGGFLVKVGINVDDVAELKKEMSSIVSEVAEMRHEMRSLLIKIYSALKDHDLLDFVHLLVMVLADYQSMDS
ncbi:hypothetical protein Cgig2_000234 [Carnegiea gigantea]|uniref:GRF-like zinc ribbon domain-containing protein n=1 Tax=Carnegiea gigantea TaxID=171969 RepID=A0A9Q1JSW5_9CARY|nr:hypothetical protein Cgig2_000234 [Carnegiea gigantea]